VHPAASAAPTLKIARLSGLLVHRDAHDAFIDASAGAFEQMRVGDPWDPATTVGPMIRPEHRRRVLGYIDSAIDEGGSIVHEGARPLPDRGWFVNPVLIGAAPSPLLPPCRAGVSPSSVGDGAAQFPLDLREAVVLSRALFLLALPILHASDRSGTLRHLANVGQASSVDTLPAGAFVVARADRPVDQTAGHVPFWPGVGGPHRTQLREGVDIGLARHPYHRLGPGRTHGLQLAARGGASPRPGRRGETANNTVMQHREEPPGVRVPRQLLSGQRASGSCMVGGMARPWSGNRCCSTHR
jgi:hypothetical protein